MFHNEHTDPVPGSFEIANAAMHSLVAGLGPGTHHLVCAGGPDASDGLGRCIDVACAPDGTVTADPAQILVFCISLAAILAPDRPGGVVARTYGADGREAVRGWVHTGRWLAPLTAIEVFAAYCLGPIPMPPEWNVDYLAGTPLENPWFSSTCGEALK